MENKELSPSESLALIANVIMEAKTRFRDNGFAFIFLGLCSFVSSLGQFVLLELKLYKINYFPYFIMPLAGALTFFYYSRKRREVKSKNIIGFLLSALGIFLGINMTIAGFFFWNRFGIALIPYMLVLFSIWPVLTGVLIKNKIFIFIGTIINLIAYGAFFVDRIYHPLVLSIVSLIGIVLPGILLNSRK